MRHLFCEVGQAPHVQFRQGRQRLGCRLGRRVNQLFDDGAPIVGRAKPPVHPQRVTAVRYVVCHPRPIAPVAEPHWLQHAECQVGIGVQVHNPARPGQSPILSPVSHGATACRSASHSVEKGPAFSSPAALPILPGAGRANRRKDRVRPGMRSLPQRRSNRCAIRSPPA